MQDFFPTAVYLLCFLTSSVCAYLLARSYRKSGARLLLWSAISFVLLAANNLLVGLDLVVIGDSASLQWPRLILSLGAAAVLLFGFIWDLEE
ncbi:MAG: DUF5985 family protein [Pseudomonadota bacterium]|nr:DUF5985 family protein [Pseudomonadota bacterium]